MTLLDIVLFARHRDSTEAHSPSLAGKGLGVRIPESGAHMPYDDPSDGLYNARHISEDEEAQFLSLSSFYGGRHIA